MTPPVRAFLATRLPLVVTGYLVLTLFPVHPVEGWQHVVFPDNHWIDGWVRWDSMWYEAVANSGSRLVPANFSSANFFPMYSWVSWLLALPLRPFLDHERAFFIAALFVSSASFIGALIATHRIAVMLVSPSVAGRTMWLIALFPFSFFLTAVYADAFYFCLAAWSLYFAVLGRWWPACALAAAAMMTRIPGAALGPALALEYLRQRRFRWGDAARGAWPFAILAVTPLLLGAYFEWRYGDPLAFLRARQEMWGRASGLEALSRDFRYFFSGSVFACRDLAECVREFEPTRTLLGYWYVALMPVSAALVVYAARTLGVALTTWALVSILMALPNGMDGVGRFTAVLFPVFIALAMLLRRRAAFLAVCAFCVPFLFLFFAQFARWRQVL